MSFRSGANSDLTLNNLTVNGSLTTNSIINTNTTTTNLTCNGEAVFNSNTTLNGGNLQINSADGVNPYLDMTCVGGNADYDIRFQALDGESTVAGQGALYLLAEQGLILNGPMQTPLVNAVDITCTNVATLNNINISGTAAIDILNCETLNMSGNTTLNGGNLQINSANGVNPYLDMTCVGGNADYDIRFQALDGESTVAGQGALYLLAEQGLILNGPIQTPLVTAVDITCTNVAELYDLTVSHNTILTEVQCNGDVSFLGGNLQINGINNTNAYIDLNCVGGDADYDVRIQVLDGESSVAGKGRLAIYGEEGIYTNGPVQTTNLETPQINGASPLIAAGFGSVFTGGFTNSECSPTTASNLFTIMNTTPCNGILLTSSSAYSIITSNPSQTNVIINGLSFIQYSWIVYLQGGGETPQPSTGNINYVIF